ncbi:effector binding domain-containing protein [Paenibacillus mesophilus]|uniref:effector binding domain-containing protein n=1 Tax=Paenibacillus mesophilus TaxID=2582849 RepID=UPI0013051F1F|nr:effector binding domain-containing protein [Paenibacillus mesophilus]
MSESEAVKVNIDEFMQVRFERREAVSVVGVKGGGPDDENRLFDEIKARGDEIAHKKNLNHYLVIIPNGLIIAHEVTESDGPIPEGMVGFTIPADEYAVCRFEERYIGSFWGHICKEPVKSKYNLNFTKPRFEIFAEHLQPQGVTEIYIPTNG